ncbi:MAG: FkbM family methyltransferase [Rhodothermales bacterium]
MKSPGELYATLFASPRWAGFNRLLLRCGLRGLGVNNYENDTISGEHYLIERILPRLIERDTPLFLDIGAHTGAYTRVLGRRFPQATIHAFEPHPRNFERLRASNVPGATYHNVALGAEDAVLMLYDRADQDGSEHASLHEAVISDLHRQPATRVEITVRTLDEVALEENLTFIDFMKIDTEGHELAVLRGASSLLARGAIGCIQFEFNEMHTVSRSFFRDFRLLLSTYDLYRLLPRGLLKLGTVPLLTELYAYQNILAVPGERAHLLPS